MDKLLIFYAIILFNFTIHSFLSCSNNKNKIITYRITYDFPIVNWDSTITDGHKEYSIYYYRDINMYKFNYTFDSSVNGERKLHEERVFFLVFHKDSIYGQAYYPNSVKTEPVRLKVDSVLQINTLQNSNFDSLSRSQVDSSFFDSKGNFVKMYNPVPTQKNREKFSLYFFYSKRMTQVKETFSKAMDNEDKMKLFKIKILAHGQYYDDYKIAFPKREILYQISEGVAEKEAINYIDNYRKKY